MRLWDLASGQELRRFDGHAGAVQVVAFSSNGLLALSGGADKTLRIWDLAGGKEVGQCQDTSAAVTRAVFTPDGKFIVAASLDQLRLWKVAGGQEVRRLPLLYFHILCVANPAVFPVVSAGGAGIIDFSFSTARIGRGRGLAHGHTINLSQRASLATGGRRCRGGFRALPCLWSGC